MKKITLILILTLSFNFTFSQVLFEDDFDGSGPGLVGWTLINVDGLTQDPNVAQFTDAWIQVDDFDNAGDMVAMSTSWYSPPGTADDWMITPAIDLSLVTDPIITLSWDEEAQDPDFPDGYEVLVSTTGNTVADFTDPPVYTTAAASGAVWTTQSANLSAYNGNTTVYIAWRNNSTDRFVLMINNVLLEVLPDVAITSSGEQYTQIPLEQTAPIGTSATIENIQSVAVTNAIATVTISDGTSTVYTANTAAFAIAGNTTQPVTFPGYTPTAIGTYTATYSVTIAETDGDPANNMLTTIGTEITANTYARDDNTQTGDLGIGGVGGAQLGQMYDILVTEDILSVTFAINGSADLPGTTTFASVWDMVGGVPNAIVAQTDVVTISATNDGVNPPELYTANITGGPFTLAPGPYVITVEEGAFHISVVTTNAIATPGTTFVNWPTAPIVWGHNEDYGFSNSFIIRPNFQDDTLSVEDFNLEDITISLYPNPASNQVTLSNPNQVALEKASITDIAGRIVKTYDLNGTTDSQRVLDVSLLSSGNYFVTITSSNGAVIKKLVIN